MKLVTWNTQWCRGIDGRVSPQRIVQTARALADFDVLCLQEIAQGFDHLPGAPGDQPRELAALLPGFRIFFGAAIDEFSPDGRRRRFGNLVATRLTVWQVQHHPLPWPPDPGVRSMQRMSSSVTLQDPQLGVLRVMTTHLEYYSSGQRMAQARALRELHAEACARAATPPLPQDNDPPYQAKQHTALALLCGDCNFGPDAAEYREIQAASDGHSLHDAWPLVNGEAAHHPTFRVFDSTHGHEPIACDFAFVSDTLVPHVQALHIDAQTRASDHQPLLLELG